MTTDKTQAEVDGAVGGRTRAANMTKKERSEVAALAAAERWGKDLPRATHSGFLKIAELEIPCFVVGGGTRPLRLISQGGMSKTLGMSKGGTRRFAGDRVANFLAGNAINAFVPEKLRSITNMVVRFRTPQGPVANGYEATILADICRAVLAARRAGALTTVHHARIAEQCEVLQGAFAEVGVVALVDEATGYQEARARDELAKILEAFIAKELRPWVKTFPPEFYKEMFRLRSWQFPPPGQSNAKPLIVGRFTNDLVYSRLAPGILDELRRVSPRDEKGRLKHHYHRKLTEDIGYQKLREHLAVVTAFMRASPSWDGFIRSLDLACPRFGANYLLKFDGAAA